MRGTAETPDLILSGEIGVNKTVNTESLNIYENGNYTPPAGVDGYNDIHVDVRPVIDQITIRANGTYEASGEVDGYSPVVVNVPQSAAKVYAKNINANGNYYPDAGYDGFSQVSVNVPATPLRPLNVTENGEYNPPSGEGYSKVVVDVTTDPEIESITITENGTYAAPTGVDGYSPVIVNVPPPEDAYYIKDMTPGAIASFNDGADAPLNSLTASIVPVQAGSGDPSPTNVRPISGWTNETITVTDDLQNPTVTHTTTIPFTDGQGQSVEVFGGSVDVVNGGEQQRTLGYVDLGTLNWALENGIFRLTTNIGAKITSNTSEVANMICSIYKTVSQSDMGSDSIDQCVAGLNWGYGVRIKDTNYTDATAFKQAMNGVQLVYELATPTTFYTQPTSIKSLDGVNNVFASTGDILSGSYFSKTPD